MGGLILQRKRFDTAFEFLFFSSFLFLAILLFSFYCVVNLGRLFFCFLTHVPFSSLCK